MPVTQDITDVATAIAEADPRIADLLANNPYAIEGLTPLAGNEVGLRLRFEETPTFDWSGLSACEIEGAEGPATGLDVQIDLDDDRVTALSPRWGVISCLEFD